MALKRTVTLEPGDMPVTKRLKRIETQVKKNRPEMKFCTVYAGGTGIAGSTTAVYNLTAIGEGDSAGGERDGNKVKVWRVEIRGVISDNLDVYLLQAHTAAAPTSASFGGTASRAAPFLTDGATNVTFTEWAHADSKLTTSYRYSIIRKFRGMEVSFAGTSTTPSRNGLYLVVRNSNTTTEYGGSSCRVWYTDA